MRNTLSILNDFVDYMKSQDSDGKTTGMTIHKFCDWMIEQSLSMDAEEYLKNGSEILINLCVRLKISNSHRNNRCKNWSDNLFVFSQNLKDILGQWTIAVDEEKARQYRNQVREKQNVLLEILKQFDSDCNWPEFSNWINRQLISDSPVPAPAVPDDPGAQEARALLAGLDEVTLARYRIIGGYTRYDETVRNVLQDAKQKIVAGCERPSCTRENHLIWAAPGTGKTYFVQQIAKALPDVTYVEINLAGCNETEFQTRLQDLDSVDRPCLCLIDEIDAKPEEMWPYEKLLPYLDARVERDKQFVFVLVGSGGDSVAQMRQRIATRHKGNDLLSRVPNEYEIAPMSIGDRMLVVLSQFRQAGKEAGREVKAVEKLGLYYVALSPRLGNARQLREFAVRAIERAPSSDDRIKYDHLFSPGDRANKDFWLQVLPLREELENKFMSILD